ncbi:MAG: hypothetical protein NDI67_08075 [Sulfuritalea sp.]|nr:hypothetical protein [Sulfuritalea sp.]
MLVAVEDAVVGEPVAILDQLKFIRLRHIVKQGGHQGSIRMCREMKRKQGKHGLAGFHHVPEIAVAHTVMADARSRIDTKAFKPVRVPLARCRWRN